MAIQDINQTLRGDVCGNIALIKTYMKNFATSPCIMS